MNIFYKQAYLVSTVEVYSFVMLEYMENNFLSLPASDVISRKVEIVS